MDNHFKNEEQILEDLLSGVKKLWGFCWGLVKTIFKFTMFATIIAATFLYLTLWSPPGGRWNELYHSENFRADETAEDKAPNLEGVFVHTIDSSFLQTFDTTTEEKKQIERRIGFWVVTTDDTFDYRWFDTTPCLAGRAPQVGDAIRIVKTGSAECPYTTETHDQVGLDTSFIAHWRGYLMRRGWLAAASPE